MKLIDSINDDAKQKFTLIGENAERIAFSLYYLPTQQAWIFNMAYNEISLNGLQLVVGPNILRGYKNIIPFGISCVSIDRLDPFYLDDFLTGRIKIYLLNQSDVNLIEQALAG